MFTPQKWVPRCGTHFLWSKNRKSTPQDAFSWYNLYMSTNYQLDYTKTKAQRQLVLPMDYALFIPENEPVRLLDAVLEELNYKQLQHLYSPKGRKPAISPRIFFKLFIFSRMEGIYSLRKLQRQCHINLQYKWLLEGHPVPSFMAFQRFFARLTLPVLEDLFAQLIQVLATVDSIDFAEAFIDGTKIEANANRYTFVWKKSVAKNFEKLRLKLKALQEDVGTLLAADLSDMDTETISSHLETYMKKEHIEEVHGSGKRKTTAQRLIEKSREASAKQKTYEKHLNILGARNSYAKTDHDATFMRMKEDHMKNGQLKPAYNIQVAAHSEYILGIGVFQNPTDTLTLRPFLNELEALHGQKFQYIVADAGYDGEENLAFLEEHGYRSCIKPSSYEKEKTRKWKNDIGRAENMRYDEDTDTFLCASGKRLLFKGVRRQKTGTGYLRESKVYEAETCEGCPHRLACQKLWKGELPKHPKKIYLSMNYNELKKRNLETFLSEHGTTLRINRSIQVEGIFGVVKEDYGFRRLLHRGKEKVKKELLLLAIGFNLQKLHNRNMAGRIGLRLFAQQHTA